MEGKWIINGFDISPYLAEGGVGYGANVRQGRDIVALSGTLHRKEVRKRVISFQLVTMSARAFSALQEALSRQGTMEYPEKNGSHTVKTFYFSEPQYATKTVRGGNTFYSGINFEAEER